MIAPHSLTTLLNSLEWITVGVAVYIYTLPQYVVALYSYLNLKHKYLHETILQPTQDIRFCTPCSLLQEWLYSAPFESYFGRKFPTVRHSKISFEHADRGAFNTGI